MFQCDINHDLNDCYHQITFTWNNHFYHHPHPLYIFSSCFIYQIFFLPLSLWEWSSLWWLWWWSSSLKMMVHDKTNIVLTFSLRHQNQNHLHLSHHFMKRICCFYFSIFIFFLILLSTNLVPCWFPDYKDIIIIELTITWEIC